MKKYCVLLSVSIAIYAFGCGGNGDDEPGGQGGEGGAAGGAGTGGSGGETGGTGGTAGVGGSAGTAGTAGTAGSGGETGGVGGTAGGGGEVDPAFDELPAKIAGALCTSIETCVGAEAVAWEYGEGKCAEGVTAGVQDGAFPYIADSIKAGRTAFQPDQIDACAAFIAGLGCEIDTARFFKRDACAAVMAGSVQEGGSCGIDADCAGNAYCKMDGGACPGVCTALSALNGPCLENDQCQDGLACSSGGTCVTPAASGGQCGGNTGARCKLGLVCLGADTATGTPGNCRSKAEFFVVPTGQTCDINAFNLCQEGLSCIVTLQGSTPVLTCGARVGAGQACNFAVPDQCPFGEYCAGIDLDLGVIQGTCQPLPGADQPCAMGTDCAPGLYCEADTKCHAVNRLGGPCVGNPGCASQLCQGGVCARPAKCEL